MMKIKLNRFERIAGLFMLTAIGGTALTALSVAVKQGWFESKTYLSTNFESADGVHQGTLVQIAGLRAGAVESVELLSANQVKVHFYVLGKFKERLRDDSHVQLLRPFIIGERVLDVSVGSEDQPMVAANAVLASQESLDLMTMMSGRKLNSTLGKFGSMLDSIQRLASAFLEKDRTEAMIRAFDRIDPLMKNMNTMSLGVGKLTQELNKSELQKVVNNLASLTDEMNKILPVLNEQNPELAKDLGVMTQNLAVVLKALGPAVQGIGPELPDASHRLMEALNETVIVLKAMQKSFFFRSNVREVKEEEENRPLRLPAQEKTSEKTLPK